MKKSIYSIIILTFLIFLLQCKSGNDTNESNTKNSVLTFKITNNISEDDLSKHIKALFTNIEEKIKNNDFKGWYNSLSRQYQHYISDAAVLKDMSEKSDFLYSRNIVLKTPQDYFKYIVIGSREGGVLVFDSYDVVDEYHIVVNCKFADTYKFEYNFIFEDKEWKLDR